jgi:hypothetical protein
LKRDGWYWLAAATGVLLTVAVVTWPWWWPRPQPSGLYDGARIVSMQPGHRRQAHMIHFTVRDDRGRIGRFSVVARLNRCSIGMPVAARVSGVLLLVDRRQCQRSE